MKTQKSLTCIFVPNNFDPDIERGAKMQINLDTLLFSIEKIGFYGFIKG